MIVARLLPRAWRRARPAPPAVVSGRYVDHNVPDSAVAGARCVLRVAVENTSTTTWLRDPPDGHYLGVGLYVDEQLASVGRLIKPAVQPGEQATLSIVFTWPDEPGDHLLKLDLLINNRTWFSLAGTPPLELTVRVRAEEATRTDALQKIAHRYNECFFTPGQGMHRTRAGEPAYPMFAASARGCSIVDVEGREYVDLHMGWGCNLLGYAEPRVQEEIAQTLCSGGIASLTHRAEIEVSEALCDAFGLGDDVVFGKNGSDVTTWAVRVARVATGRRTVLFAGYHGWQDWNAAGQGFAETGIPAPPGPAVRLRYADQAALEAAVAEHAADLAAIVIEPAATTHDLTDPGHAKDAGYLRAAETLARQHGALLVFDEIFTGFRFRDRFAQTHFGVRPDLTCLAKALSNGMALSALAGRGGVLRRSAGRIVYAPTNKGEALAFASARAALRIHLEADVPSEVWAAGELLRSGVNALSADRELPCRLSGPPYRMYMQIPGDVEQRVHARTLLQQELARHGVVSHRGYAILSRRHDGPAIERCLAAYAKAFDAVRDAYDGGALRRLDIPDVWEEAAS